MLHRVAASPAVALGVYFLLWRASNVPRHTRLWGKHEGVLSDRNVNTTVTATTHGQTMGVLQPYPPEQTERGSLLRPSQRRLAPTQGGILGIPSDKQEDRSNSNTPGEKTGNTSTVLQGPNRKQYCHTSVHGIWVSHPYPIYQTGLSQPYPGVG